MSETVTELKSLFEELLSLAETLGKPEIAKPLEALEKSATEVGKAWGHSWLGYQSRVYYQGLEPPPPGAHFSSEWGFKERFTVGTRGEWLQFGEDAVETEIARRAGNPDITKAQEASESARRFLEQKRDDVISILRTAKSAREDSFIGKLLEETEQLRVFTLAEFISHMQLSAA
jgi:hypothetical protein